MLCVCCEGKEDIRFFREFVGILLPLGPPCCGWGVTWSLCHQLCHLSPARSRRRRRGCCCFLGMEGSAGLGLFEQLPRWDFSAAGDSPPLPRTKHRASGDAKGESLPCSGVTPDRQSCVPDPGHRLLFLFTSVFKGFQMELCRALRASHPLQP